MEKFDLKQGDRTISIVQLGQSSNVYLRDPEASHEYRIWLVEVLTVMRECERHSFLERYLELPIKAPRSI